jgi:inosine-uridine nucleoside N-ribohydrolase
MKAEGFETLLRRLEPPQLPIDVVIDTDTYNEIDDQFALSFLIKSSDVAKLRGIYAAPFHNQNSDSPADGMEKSYAEIIKMLGLMDRCDLKLLVKRGSTRYLPTETKPVDSDAARHLANLAMEYSSEQPLYVVAIGAITNVASALLLRPEIVDRIVIVWLGGSALHWPDNREFNLGQDVAAARVVFGCTDIGMPALVQLPCMGVVSEFRTTAPELRHWLSGKNKLCDYLENHTIEEAERDSKISCWSRIIWDVCAVGWLFNKEDTFMKDRIINAPIPEYDHHWAHSTNKHPIRYVYHIERDALFEKLFTVLTVSR